MKKLVTLLVLSLYLLSSPGLKEVKKLPVLIQHFHEHKLINNQITFLAYLGDHYDAMPHTDDDEERDNQLPFKTVDLTGSFTPAIPSFYTNNFQKSVRAIVINDSFLYKENFLPKSYCGKVWQPPKSIINS